MFNLIFGKKTGITTIVFVVADYRIALIEREGEWWVPVADAQEQEMPSETGARAVEEALGIEVDFITLHNVPEMRTDADPLPLPFHIDAMEHDDGRHCQFYYIATTPSGQTTSLENGRWFTKDELKELTMHGSYKDMCLRAFEIYLDLEL